MKGFALFIALASFFLVMVAAHAAFPEDRDCSRQHETVVVNKTVNVDRSTTTVNNEFVTQVNTDPDKKRTFYPAAGIGSRLIQFTDNWHFDGHYAYVTPQGRFPAEHRVEGCLQYDFPLLDLRKKQQKKVTVDPSTEREP